MKNHVSLIGRLGGAPEVRQTQTGTTVCNFSLATTERRKKGEQWEEHTEWHKIVCFGNTAQAVQKYCGKGKQVAVEGRLSTRKWQDKDGIDRWTTEILGDEILFLADAQSRREDDAL